VSSIQVKVDGQWIAGIAPWGELTWSHAADGGCKEASWKMDLPSTYVSPNLRRNKLVEIRFGPQNIWQGILTEPDYDDDWTFTAQGLSTLGYGDFLAFDSGLNTTSTPDTAIDQAIARGVPWTRPASISAVAVGSATDVTDSINYVGDLLDAYATGAGQRWGVNAAGQVYCAADPTTPTWCLSPGSGRFGLADDDYASDLFGRYQTSSGALATATVADTVARGALGRREFPVDLTPLGTITPLQAQTYLSGLLAKGKSRMGYTNGLTVNASQLTTPGGTPASLPLVEAGDMVRMFGVVNEQGQSLPYLDWVIDETSYEAGSDTIGLTPVGLVARTLADVFAVVAAA
jgi:hypothetical protein